jgi:ABC-type nitrate/sulfonate/bicarbonate transport system permease component
MKYFTPFEENDKLILQFLALTQVGLLFGLWFALPMGVIPNPIEIIKSWHKLASTNGMLLELWSSLTTIWTAIFWSTAISLVIGCLSPLAFFKSLSQWLTGLRFLGFAGITFLFTLWTDSGSELKIWLLTFGMTTFLLTNVLTIVASLTQEEIDYARTIKMNGWHINYEILMRGKLDEILDLVRQNAAIGWTLLSMVEGLVRSEGGIGALLLIQSKYLNLSSIFAIQITILTYGIVQDQILRYLRAVICPYIVMSKVK